MSGTLFIIPTPIGNLDDITLRAIKVLSIVDVIAVEDTRHTGQLLHHLQIKKPMLSYQEHNELQRIPELLQRLTEGQNIALVSDAGTPALSDPGFKLIRAAVAQHIPVDVLPGASAIIVGLVGSGLPTDKFYYGGFLPRTSSKRQTFFREIEQLVATIVVFESPHRVGSALADAETILGNRPVVIARELTKLHQEYWPGSLSDAVALYKNKTIKGEVVIIIGGLTS
jgi:16S rRNA (cytidine1402-2'-O)-methyltransferase